MRRIKVQGKIVVRCEIAGLTIAPNTFRKGEVIPLSEKFYNKQNLAKLEKLVFQEKKSMKSSEVKRYFSNQFGRTIFSFPSTEELSRGIEEGVITKQDLSENQKRMLSEHFKKRSEELKSVFGEED